MVLIAGNIQEKENHSTSKAPAFEVSWYLTSSLVTPIQPFLFHVIFKDARPGLEGAPLAAGCLRQLHLLGIKFTGGLWLITLRQAYLYMNGYLKAGLDLQ